MIVVGVTAAGDLSAVCSKHVESNVVFRVSDGCPACKREAAQGSVQAAWTRAVQGAVDEVAAKVAPGLPAPRVSFDVGGTSAAEFPRPCGWCGVPFALGRWEHVPECHGGKTACRHCGEPGKVGHACPKRPAERRGCACGARMGQRCAETCADMLARRAEWDRTHCGARPTGRVLSRFCALDGHGIETHGTDPCGGERCRLDKGHAGDHKDYDSGMQWPRSPVEERRAREAALVALVAAVPEGLDPVGWRAAVLSIHEGSRRMAEQDAQRAAAVRELAWTMKGGYPWNFGRGEAPAWFALVEVGRAAYHRALAPAPKVQPERRRRGGPVVVVDRGEDE